MFVQGACDFEIAAARPVVARLLFCHTTLAPVIYLPTAKVKEAKEVREARPRARTQKPQRVKARHEKNRSTLAFNNKTKREED